MISKHQHCEYGLQRTREKARCGREGAGFGHSDVSFIPALPVTKMVLGRYVNLPELQSSHLSSGDINSYSG